MYFVNIDAVFGRFRDFKKTVWRNERVEAVVTEHIRCGIMAANVDNLPEEHKKYKFHANNRSSFLKYIFPTDTKVDHTVRCCRYNRALAEMRPLFSIDLRAKQFTVNQWDDVSIFKNS
jgi:hypothetical protein